MASRYRLRLNVVWPALIRLLALTVLAAILGVLFGAQVGLWFAVLGFATLLLTHLLYLSLLGAWLEQPTLSSIPEGYGAWAEVFTRLYKGRRASELSERRLAENEERFRRTISALPEGIVLIDSSLQIEWCNPVAERHLGIALRGDSGLRLTNLVRDPAFVAYLTSNRFDQPLVFRPLGTPGLVLSIVLIEFEPNRSIVITRDVTQSERVDAMRRDFVANVSHELRTPLTVVNGFLEMLLDSDLRLDETRRRHLQLMQEQAMRMNRLVEDLLMLSRLESEETAVSDDIIDMPQLVQEVIEEARVLSHGRHNIRVQVEKIDLKGNRDELRSAFANLLSNAIRYTPAGGVIDVHWLPNRAGAKFSVQDSGIGIASDHIPRLTERFYRVDKSRSRETGGTGLGLAIVKHVLLRHQGTLEVESQPGLGSVFTAQLPSARLLTVAIKALQSSPT